MNRNWMLGVFAVVVAGLAWAQATHTPEQRAQRSTEILAKTRRIDLLNHLLPIVLTKAQLDALLPALEKARADVRRQEQAEFDALLKLEPKLDEALKEGIEKNQMPSAEVMAAAKTSFRDLMIKRAGVIGANVERVAQVVEKSWNVGQKRAAANALQPSLLDPSLDPAQMDEAAKLNFYIRVILLDVHTYDMLLQMRKAMK